MYLMVRIDVFDGEQQRKRLRLDLRGGGDAVGGGEEGRAEAGVAAGAEAGDEGAGAEAGDEGQHSDLHAYAQACVRPSLHAYA